MANPNVFDLRFMRLRDPHGFMGHALSVCAFAVYGLSVDVRALIIELAQGNFVSISRGSPPPEPR